MLALTLLAAALVLPAAARADLTDEQALADRFAPVVRLVAQDEECGPGEPYEPIDVDLLFGENTVALRGPWNTTDLVQIGPEAKDLVNRYEYHLDYPGSALDPGCDYERWNRRLTEGSSPTVYAHVAGDPEHPGQLSLQYWFFYVFNQFNNLHEGDWEMIQLDFDAADAADALTKTPVAVGYSSHEGAERADWGDEKLEIVDGTHPACIPLPDRTPTSSGRPSTSGAQRKQASAATTRRARTARSVRWSRRSQAIQPRLRTVTRGSRSRGGGGSSRELSSTGRPDRT
jgi:hypothetical protein